MFYLRYVSASIARKINYANAGQLPAVPAHQRVRVENWRDVRTGLARPLATKEQRLYVCRMDSYDEVLEQLFGVACIEGMTPRHGAVDTRAAFLLALKSERPGLEVYPVRCQRQGLRGPAPGIQQRPAVGTHFPVWLRFCGLPKCLALRAGQIQPVALVVVQAHAGWCG